MNLSIDCEWLAELVQKQECAYSTQKQALQYFSIFLS